MPRARHELLHPPDLRVHGNVQVQLLSSSHFSPIQVRWNISHYILYLGFFVRLTGSYGIVWFSALRPVLARKQRAKVKRGTEITRTVKEVCGFLN